MLTTSFGHSIRRNQHCINLRHHLSSAVSFVLNQLQKYNIRDVVVVFQETGEFVNTKFFCRVCSMLHEPRALSKPRSYPDFNDWWRGKGTCINGSWRKYDQAKANFEKSSRQVFVHVPEIFSMSLLQIKQHKKATNFNAYLWNLSSPFQALCVPKSKVP